jgi:hypothetical protein
VSTAILNELSGSPEAIHTIKKCHKFSPKDKIYLEQQFSVNPYSSTEDRAQVTQCLGISEKCIQTWFNNVRQRRNAPRMTSTSRLNAPLSREGLERLTFVQHTSKSLFEKSATIPPGSAREPSIEAIEAAIKQKLEMGQDENTARSTYSCSDDSPVADDSVLIAGDADVPSVHCFEVASRSSQVHSSSFSSASNASYRLRPWYKLEKRRVHKRSTSRSRGKLTTEEKNSSHKSTS